MLQINFLDLFASFVLFIVSKITFVVFILTISLSITASFFHSRLWYDVSWGGGR